MKHRFVSGILASLLSISLVLPMLMFNVPTVSADTLIHENTAEVSSGATNYPNYTKVKYWATDTSGTLRVDFDLASSIQEPPLVYGRIYKNGVAIGTERSTDSDTYQIFSENIVGWAVGDNVEIWACSDDYMAGEARVRNFRVYALPAVNIILYQYPISFGSVYKNTENNPALQALKIEVQNENANIKLKGENFTDNYGYSLPASRIKYNTENNVVGATTLTESYVQIYDNVPVGENRYVYFWINITESDFKAGGKNLYSGRIWIQGQSATTTDSKNASDNVRVLWGDSGIIDLIAIADTYVENDSPTTNYGSSGSITVSPYYGTAAHTVCRGLFKFSTYAIPDNATIVSARFNFALNDVDGGTGGFFWQAIYKQSNTDWEENEVTWNNQPAFSENQTFRIIITMSASEWSYGSNYYGVDYGKGYPFTKDIVPGQIIGWTIKPENENFGQNATEPGWIDYYSLQAYGGDEFKPRLRIMINVPPAQPKLYLPDNNTDRTDNKPTFEWLMGTGAENHRLLIAHDVGFISITDNILLGATENDGSSALYYDENWSKGDENSLSDGIYYWKVVAINESGENESDVRWFEVDTTVSSEPAPSTPFESLSSSLIAVLFIVPLLVIALVIVGGIREMEIDLKTVKMITAAIVFYTIIAYFIVAMVGV